MRLEKLEGNIGGTIFRNEENGYTVLTVIDGRREVVAVGTLPVLYPGEQAVFEGEWVEHSSYGKQFKCVSCTPVKPTTALGIERYLKSGAVPGIGAKTAKAIVAAFGDETLRILEEEPERLQEVPGMGRKRWKAIALAFREASAEREALAFLQSYGIPANLAYKISMRYGDQAQDVIRANPYRLCEELEGVGFVTADRIASALGVAPDNPERLRAAMRFFLQEAAVGAGHVFLWREELMRRAASLHVAEELLEDTVRDMALHRELALRRTEDGEDGRIQVWLPGFERAEREVAQRLCELMASRTGGAPDGAERMIDRYEQRHGMTFSLSQRSAIEQAISHGVFVITGGPGTGKTTIINCIIQLLAGEGRIELCAPTGRAAKRMSEATGLESRTIHRMLEFGGEEGSFVRNEENPLEAACVIVDEASMIDLMLMRSLLRAIEPGTRLLIVGDSDQLPSVGAGNVLGDILASGVIPAARLTEIYRQAQTSQIVSNAHRINRGEMPVLNGADTDFFFERTDGPAATARTVVQLAASRLPKYLRLSDEARIRGIQVLAPARRGECGVQALNQLLQAALNPAEPGKPELKHGESLYRLGDKVMQNRNDYDISWTRPSATGYKQGRGVFNGDVGFVTDVDPEANTVEVTFEDDRVAVYGRAEQESLELAYCISVHKSQGSEFTCVVMPVFSGPAMLLTRNLFYTALTRAKKLVVLVGREETIAQMVENNYILHRNTSLAERLRAAEALIHA